MRERVSTHLSTPLGIPIIFDWSPNSPNVSFTLTNLDRHFGDANTGRSSSTSGEVHQCVVQVRRHPEWRKRILTAIQTSRNQSELRIATRLWGLIGTSEEIDEQHSKWLEDGDLIRTRFGHRSFSDGS